MIVSSGISSPSPGPAGGNMWPFSIRAGFANAPATHGMYSMGPDSMTPQATWIVLSIMWWGASGSPATSASVAIFTISVIPPTRTMSGCRMSTAFGADVRVELEARPERLPHGDRDVQGGGEPRVAGDVLAEHRLLEPRDAQLLQLAADAHRRRQVPFLVGVDGDPGVVAQGLADLADPPDVVPVILVADLHLDAHHPLRRGTPRRPRSSPDTVMYSQPPSDP